MFNVTGNRSSTYILQLMDVKVNWKLLTGVFIGMAAIVSLSVYNVTTPLQCYQCNWAASTLKPVANSSCHLNQHQVSRQVLGASVKTCSGHESYCGVSRTILSFNIGNGVERHEYGLIRGCFSRYPLPTAVQDLDGVSTTYYGPDEGVDYGQVFNGRVKANLTVVGRYCSAWNLCNARDAPHSAWHRSFLDSKLFYDMQMFFHVLR